MEAGDCFYNKSSPSAPSHPWIIISDPNVDPDNVLIVNLTDAENYHDNSCVLSPSDNPWIKKKSCVAFQYANLTSIAKLEKAISAGLMFNQSNIGETVLKTIRVAAILTEELKGSHKKLLRSQI